MRVTLTLAASSFALAAALAANGANAQTVITRTITTEPVETTVTQTPTGTIVTRRPVQGQVVAPAIAPAAPTMAGPAILQPVLPATTVVDTVPDTVDAVTTREVVRRAEAARAAPRLTTRQVSGLQDRVSHAKTVRKTTQTRRTTTTRPVPRLALNPRERQIVYETIVEREVAARPRVVVAPPLAAVAPAPYVQPQVVPAVRPPIVAADEDVVVQPAASIAVGTVLPPNVPLYAVPQHVALSVPATRSYSYAWLGGRAYLVDPVTGTVVADVTD